VLVGPGEHGHLAARVVDVVLAGDVVAGVVEDPGDGVAEDGVAGAPDVDGAGRVRARVLDDDGVAGVGQAPQSSACADSSVAA